MIQITKTRVQSPPKVKNAAAVALGKRSWASLTKDEQRASIQRANAARWPKRA